MSLRRQKIILVLCAILVVTGALVIHMLPAREPSYAGKSVSYWCDHLPMTVAFPMAPGGFARMGQSSNNQQAVSAIDALGTNCLPELLKRLQRKNSRLEFESRKLAAKVGLIKQNEVGIGQVRREQALTGVLQLNSRARAIVPELIILRTNGDVWASAAAGYVLQKIIPKEATTISKAIPR